MGHLFFLGMKSMELVFTGWSHLFINHFRQISNVGPDENSPWSFFAREEKKCELFINNNQSAHCVDSFGIRISGLDMLRGFSKVGHVTHFLGWDIEPSHQPNRRTQQGYLVLTTRHPRLTWAFSAMANRWW